ncbi:MAG: DNA-protecting protein DprA [Flavobacteriaceae bacterium]|nr:MAG: DNA-protecting protein DprA [Flavobacteriaceae bacterium]
MTENELIQTLALQKTDKIGDISAKKLIEYCGSVEAVFLEKKSRLQKIGGIGSYILRDLFKKDYLIAAQEELKFMKNNGIQWHFYQDDTYPERLKHCIDGPILLFQRGKINLNRQPTISVVGTRNITRQGIQFCEELVSYLSPFNPVIVSGFAYGTDITAQKAAIDNNLQTIACLAHGLNQIYPKAHAKYIDQVEAHGGFFTDFWSSDDFNRNNFLKRNRIIAGLSEATIIIESAEKGGSLVTAEIANSYNREIFAVPGRTNDSQSVGCNNLIKLQRAHLLSQPADIPYILNWQLKTEQKPIQQQLFTALEGDEKIIYEALKNKENAHIDGIAISVNMPTYKVASILLNLELKGVIRPLPGKLFELV